MNNTFELFDAVKGEGLAHQNRIIELLEEIKGLLNVDNQYLIDELELEFELKNSYQIEEAYSLGRAGK